MITSARILSLWSVNFLSVPHSPDPIRLGLHTSLELNLYLVSSYHGTKTLHMMVQEYNIIIKEGKRVPNVLYGLAI